VSHEPEKNFVPDIHPLQNRFKTIIIKLYKVDNLPQLSYTPTMDDQSSFSIKDTRDNLSELVEQAARNGKTFIITKFGRPKALITPITKTKKASSRTLDQALQSIKGMWADREDMKDSAAWVRKLRQEQSHRK
jgi:prevent-host-death family protein